MNHKERFIVSTNTLANELTSSLNIENVDVTKYLISEVINTGKVQQYIFERILYELKMYAKDTASLSDSQYLDLVGVTINEYMENINN